MSQFLGEIFLSHSAEKLPRRTLLRVKKFLSPKNIIDKRGKEGASRFSIKIFVPQYRIIS